MPFPFLALFVIFLVWFTFKRRAVSNKEEKTRNAFWERENAANATLKKDISQLEYIELPLDAFPFSLSDDPVLCECEAKVKDLAQKKILNLTGISNTQLKLDYGAGNLSILADCDQNYTSLICVLTDWGQQLHVLGFTTAAITVLEFAIDCHSDITSNYVLLSQLYQETGQAFRIQRLLDTAHQLNSLSRDTIIARLQESAHTQR
ncbi:MAG: hypothetical protein RR364_07515 [Lachnospiraceae bacterium]